MFHFTFLYCYMDKSWYFQFNFILKVILKSTITPLFLFTKPAQIFLGLCWYCIYTSRYSEIQTQSECIKERFHITVLTIEQILGISGNFVNIMWYHNNTFLYLSVLSMWVEWLSFNLEIIFDVEMLYFYNIFPFCHVLTLTETKNKDFVQKNYIFRNRFLLCMSVLSLL